jgi:hypothetical protein
MTNVGLYAIGTSTTLESNESPISLVYLLIFIPIVMLRWTFPNSFGDSRIGPLRNVRLDVDHVDLMPPIISKIKPVAKGVIDFEAERTGYALKAGQLTYDCRYSTMHGMPVTGGRGFRGLKPLWYNSVPP